MFFLQFSSVFWLIVNLLPKMLFSRNIELKLSHKFWIESSFICIYHRRITRQKFLVWLFHLNGRLFQQIVPHAHDMVWPRTRLVFFLVLTQAWFIRRKKMLRIRGLNIWRARSFIACVAEFGNFWTFFATYKRTIFICIRFIVIVTINCHPMVKFVFWVIKREQVCRCMVAIKIQPTLV